jgi:Fic family protein
MVNFDMQGFGAYEPDEHGRLCYRPSIPAFPKLDDVWQPLDRASKVIEAFDRALEAFPIAGVVGKLFARHDAVHSSGAEGSTTTFTDLMEFQTTLKRAKDPNDAREVAAVAEAFDELAASSAEPTTIALDIHRRLFQNAKDPFVRSQAGRWKVYPNATYDEDVGGPFFYCSPVSTKLALKEWTAFTNESDDKPELLRQALSHWMFEHIHPLADGNGRVGRLLVPIMMRRKGGLKNASAFLGEAVHLNKNLYVDALKGGRRTGDFTPWCRVFCSMVMQTANANLDRLNKLRLVYTHWQSETKSVRSHSVIHDLVPWVLTKPSFTVRDALNVTGDKVSFQAMNTAIKRLSDIGIIRQVGIGANERLFTAEEVIRLFEPIAPTADAANL